GLVGGPEVAFRFCPRSTGDLVTGRPPGDDRDRLICARCGQVLCCNPKPTASALVVQDGKVLLARRGREPFLDWWDHPGGFLAWDEHPEAAVIRELAEETGLQIRPTRLLGIYTDSYGEQADATLNLMYLAEWIGGDPEPGSDVSALAWFGPDELPDQLAFRCVPAALADWRKLMHGGERVG
ncbi:MAG TPA: NUDIX hydrolase, partial [Dehalococcoidia bacterium]|nr:NUDIX hydrolase [Dehalococcoidia bacterium]